MNLHHNREKRLPNNATLVRSTSCTIRSIRFYRRRWLVFNASLNAVRCETKNQYGAEAGEPNLHGVGTVDPVLFAEVLVPLKFIARAGFEREWGVPGLKSNSPGTHRDGIGLLVLATALHPHVGRL
jgi:hypothetical protein